MSRTTSTSAAPVSGDENNNEGTLAATETLSATDGREEMISMLVSMGFGASDAASALNLCGGRLEQAVNHLLMGVTAAAPVEPTVGMTTTSSPATLTRTGGDTTRSDNAAKNHEGAGSSSLSSPSRMALRESNQISTRRNEQSATGSSAGTLEDKRRFAEPGLEHKRRQQQEQQHQRQTMMENGHPRLSEPDRTDAVVTESATTTQPGAFRVRGLHNLDAESSLGETWDDRDNNNNGQLQTATTSTLFHAELVDEDGMRQMMQEEAQLAFQRMMKQAVVAQAEPNIITEEPNIITTEPNIITNSKKRQSSTESAPLQSESVICHEIDPSIPPLSKAAGPLPNQKQQLVVKENLFSSRSDDSFYIRKLDGKPFRGGIHIKSNGDQLVLHDGNGTPIAVCMRKFELSGEAFKIYSTSPMYRGQGKSKNRTYNGTALYTYAIVRRFPLCSTLEVKYATEWGPTYTVNRAGSPLPKKRTVRNVKNGVQMAAFMEEQNEGQHGSSSYLLSVNPGIDPCLMVCVTAICDEIEGN